MRPDWKLGCGTPAPGVVVSNTDYHPSEVTLGRLRILRAAPETTGSSRSGAANDSSGFDRARQRCLLPAGDEALECAARQRNSNGRLHLGSVQPVVTTSVPGEFPVPPAGRPLR